MKSHNISKINFNLENNKKNFEEKVMECHPGRKKALTKKRVSTNENARYHVKEIVICMSESGPSWLSCSWKRI